MRTMARRARTWAGLAAGVALVTAGCGAGGGASEGGTDDDARVEVLSACVQADECTSLEPDDFADLAAEDGVVLLDVRTPQEFAEGHLDGALNVDVSAPDFAARAAELDPGATYAVYCRSGNRSRTAMEIMRDAGVGDAADLAGGIGAWIAADLPVVTGRG